jgi:hypothetical protein
LTLIKYESHRRNKAAIALMWDLDARNHEITLLKLKHIRLKEKYGEGEIPFESKTGTGPVLLTLSFPYIRDWLNEHPFKNEPNASLICSLVDSAPANAFCNDDGTCGGIVEVVFESNNTLVLESFNSYRIFNVADMAKNS